MNPIDAALPAALALAARGFPVFPCHNDKSPTCPGGFKSATRDANSVLALWAAFPGVLVGIPTGEASGIAVLDIDSVKHREAVDWLQQHGAHLGDTWTIETRSGGQHWYFQHMTGLRSSVSKIARGVDVRADGGYVIAWSAHGYPVLSDAPLAPWPAFLDDALGVRSETRSSVLPSPDALKAFDGGRDMLAAIARQFPNDESFDDRTNWIALAHALAAAFADDPGMAEELWLEHAAKREQTPGEPERVWETLQGPHSVGSRWLVAKAKACGIDTKPYEVAQAAVVFARAGPLPVASTSINVAVSGTLEQAVARLAALNPIEYEACRRAEAKALGLRTRILDQAVEVASAMGAPEQGDAEEKLSQRQRLIETARAAGMVFWRDQDSNAYATVPHNGTIQRHKVQSGGFRLLLRSLYADRWPENTKRGPIPGSVSDSAMAEALPALEAMSLKGPVREPDVRVIRYDGAVWLDLGTADWRLVRITADRWEIIEGADVPLVRPSGMRPLPIPRHDPEALAKYEKLLNLDIKGDSMKGDLKLVMAWKVGALYPTGPFTILAFDGEQGSAKTSACRMERRSVDPNKADLRAPPKTEDDLVIAAIGGRVVGIDNLSHMPEELMDAVCRLATGTGIGKRKLYTDGDEIIFSAARPVVLNGIPTMLARGDLADRALAISLPAIPDDRRVSEEALWRDFDAVAPGLLALLLDALKTALRRLPTLELKELPRMADFARLACAAAPAFGWSEEAMLKAITDNRGAAVNAVIEAEPIATEIQRLAASGGWRGTATDLLREINQHVPFEQQRKPGWPRDGARLSARVTRISPALRRIGIDVTKDREGHQGGRVIYIQMVAETASGASGASGASAPSAS